MSALADFTNETGDPVFDGALRQGLSIELEQSPFPVVSDSKVQQMLPLMGQPKDARVTPELAQQICQRPAASRPMARSTACSQRMTSCAIASIAWYGT